MAWGSEETLKMLYAHYERTGVMPPALENRPDLSIENVVYNEAFNVLSGGRQNTDHVVNPITFTDVMNYCDCIEEFDGMERLRYWRMISACDNSFIDSVLKSRKADMAKATAMAKRKKMV
jgi:hypothetical protein